MDCLHILCTTLGLNIPSMKTQCYSQNQRLIPELLDSQSWTWIQPSQHFKFLSVPFAF
jgi:hypothetical protein